MSSATATATTTTTMTTMKKKHDMEELDSWDLHVQRQDKKGSDADAGPSKRVRHLKHKKKKKKHDGESSEKVSAKEEADFWKKWKDAQASSKSEKEEERLQALYRDPGIRSETTHGMLIDAGSTGSRLHVFEWEPRILSTPEEIQAAVAGDKLSFPGTESRWTQRLRPGLSEFAQITDDADLESALKEYFRPLLEFAESVLATKRDTFASFPIFLRATAGMRILAPPERARVMNAVRRVLSEDKSFNPFLFDQPEQQARTLSGEEEAIYDWTGVNFLLGDLLQDSQGAGTVTSPSRTHGALDLGGGSTQIAFFSPTDVMSSLFKLQIGQAKHWNVYAHSFLDYGMNEAMNRYGAHLAAEKSAQERAQGVYDPCMPVGSKRNFSSKIYIKDGQESWNAPDGPFPAQGGDTYHAVLWNNGSDTGDNSNNSNVDVCLQLAKDLLHLEKNTWCDFAHKGACSFAGVYQPRLPKSSPSNSFGEFIAFSNYYHVWNFLNLPESATIGELYDATRIACAMNQEELVNIHNNKHKSDDNDDNDNMDELSTYCFRSAYVFNLLHHGYGFEMDDSIRVSKVINGQKVGWALGAMLYEINAMPWTLEPAASPALPMHSSRNHNDLTVSMDGHSIHISGMAIIMSLISIGMLVALGLVYLCHWRRRALYLQQHYYEPVKDVNNNNVMGTAGECQALLQC